MQASQQHHLHRAVPSVHRNPSRQLWHSQLLVLQRRHHPMPALLPDHGNRSLSQARWHAAGRRRKVPNGSRDYTEVHCIVSCVQSIWQCILGSIRFRIQVYGETISDTLGKSNGLLASSKHFTSQVKNGFEQVLPNLNPLSMDFFHWIWNQFHYESEYGFR